MGRRRKTTKEFIDEAIVTHGSLYDYSRVVYSGRNTPVEIICPKPQYCPYCKISSGESEIKKVLDSKNIDYNREYKFSGCKGPKKSLPFDFYLPDYNMCIEYDGEQHFRLVHRFGGEDNFKKRQNEMTSLKTRFVKTII